MDSSRYKINKMLFIKNVSLNDCVSMDDLFEEKLMIQANDLETSYSSNSVSSNNIKDTYEKLPYIYTGISSWPKKTNLHCWYCSLVFDDVPIFIPKCVEPNNLQYLQTDNQFHLLSERSTNIISNLGSAGNSRESRYAMNREGCFCSFNCALSFIDLYYPKPHENVDKRGTLEILFYEIYNIHPQKLYKSPSKYEMIQYGGTLSPNEYKQKIYDLQEESGITAAMRIKCRETSFRNS